MANLLALQSPQDKPDPIDQKDEKSGPFNRFSR